MSNVSVELAPYFQRVGTRLNCSRRLRDRLLERIRRGAEEFVAERPEATQKEVEEYLGNPEEVAQELMEALDPAEVKRYQKRKRIGVLLVIGILTVALVAASALLIHFRNTPIETVMVGKITIYAEGSRPT